MKKVLCAVLSLTILFAAALSEPVDSIETPSTPPEIEEIIEEHQTIYRLTIYYVYYNGGTAAPTYSSQEEAGASYGVSSPDISGYTPSMSLVSGVMPARDVQYTVIYYPDGEFDDSGSSFMNLDDYEVPLGIGSHAVNVGICIE